MNKVNPFLAVAALFPLVLVSNLFIAFEAAFEETLLAKSGKLSLEKGLARSVAVVFLHHLPKLPIIY